ncbi:hypothetical protein BC938DRAFT_480012 [Jimgerdemannia flammicorona]|uniref:Nucleophile aminohydrolase n=1 Tax=Jimgerdemannia flammicorona TaxID=994334 RepID=A0A433QJK3_9FUNG|nr:hypothetical protein BC938DRAFT_480012 [Jimgerdemannia flammicorona]
MPPPPQDSTYSAARHSADYKDTDPLFPRNSVGRKTSHSQKRIVIVGVISALLLVTMVTAAVLSQAPPALPNSPLIVAKHGAVAAEVSSCSEAGVEILKEGGNAVDAAIAGALCLGVVNMFSTGIGGFMLIRLPDGHSELIDFRETAPAASNKTMFIGRPKKAQVGGLAVGVPGEIRGFGLAHSKYGKLPWRRLFEPAINMSRNGVLVGPELARRLPLFQVFIRNHADWRALFMPNGTLLKEGELLKRENLANTLEKIANEGPDVFYEGKIAEHIVSKVQATGGILTLADMRAYRAVVREPIVGYYHGRKIITGGAPTSGHALLGALNILERYNLKAEGQTPVNIHR